MRIPVIHGVIERRILVNFRVAPEVLAAILPPPFRPQIVGDYGVAGICLIRLAGIRPRFLPSFVGMASENAAHRIAVEWENGGRTHCGVFVPRRDTSSLVNSLAGGRLFPGVHHRAQFEVAEEGDHYRIAIDSLDGSMHVRVEGRVASELPGESIFGSLAGASEFFRHGSLGYSPNGRPGKLDGLELRTLDWNLEPLAVTEVESSFFADRTKFPLGSVEFESAFLMRGVRHEWHVREAICT